ncbi:hypothetical protein M1437_03000 [Patescibacteria group bacterium]|nr:hypothetical protein [Patescibacteria group bacterium]
MNKNNQPLIEFNPKLPKLSKNESQVLKLLVEAGKLIAPIYTEQEKQAQQGMSQGEIERASKQNPEILSPYTVVEKIDGKLIATPYHIKYATFLKPIAEKLEEAAKITENKEFGKVLKMQAKVLMEGKYEQATAMWLGLKPYILDISIGPLYHFDDRLLYGKASYQAWVGVLDIEGTDRLNNYKSITLSADRKALVPKERINNLDHVKAKTIDVLLLSGMMARIKFVGINTPMDVRWVEKYGSEITILNQCNDLRLNEQILPAFNKIFTKAFKQGFSREDLRRGYLRTTALHELAHSFLYYRNSLKNLQDLFPIIHELAATVLGLRMAGSLLLKDRINNKQLESMMVAFISRSFHLIEKRKFDKLMSNYALGGTIFINFMIENGAIRRVDDCIYPNFMKIFVSLHELFNILEKLLSQGTKKDAKAFIKKYSS